MCRRAFKYLKSILQLKRRGRQERLCVYHFCVANTLDGVLSHDISYIMTVQFTPEKKHNKKNRYNTICNCVVKLLAIKRIHIGQMGVTMRAKEKSALDSIIIRETLSMIEQQNTHIFI